MSRTFHVLTESESFSQRSHDNLAQWVANVIQADKDSIVLAPSSDGTLSFPPNRIRIVKGLSTYRAIYKSCGFMLPGQLFSQFLRRVLSESLQDLKPGDTVWIHNRPEFASALAPFIQQAGARLFLHIHNAQLLSKYKNLLRNSKADCHIFNSQEVETEALQKFPSLGKSAVLSRGLDAREFHPSARHAIRSRSMDAPVEQVTVVFSAYLARENDLQVFLDAMEILRLRQVPVNGTVIGGPSPEQRKLKPNQKDRRINVPSNVAFENYDSPAALGRKLRASELFCVPSSWHDTASLYLLEALACGLPVVATAGAGTREETADTPGIVVVPNAAERLAQAVQELVEDSAARQNMANMAYSSYTTQYMWHHTRASYRSVLASSALTSSAKLQLEELIPG